MHGLAVVFVHFFNQVTIEKGIVLVLDRDNRRIDIIGKRILDLIIFRFPAQIFIHDSRTTGHGADDLMKFLLRVLPLETVEHHHVGILHLVEDELAHVLVVSKKGGCIKEGHDLRDRPALGHRVKEVLQHAHAVVFDDDALGRIFFGKCGELLFSHVRRLEELHGIGRVGEFGVVILLLPLF